MVDTGTSGFTGLCAYFGSGKDVSSFSIGRVTNPQSAKGKTYRPCLLAQLLSTRRRGYYHTRYVQVPSYRRVNSVFQALNLATGIPSLIVIVSSIAFYRNDPME